jgi:hypothetical protein
MEGLLAAASVIAVVQSEVFRTYRTLFDSGGPGWVRLSNQSEYQHNPRLEESYIKARRLFSHNFNTIHLADAVSSAFFP